MSQRGKVPGILISEPMPNIKTADANLISKVHIATAANNEYLEGVLGLIKSAYRKSQTPRLRYVCKQRYHSICNKKKLELLPNGIV